MRQYWLFVFPDHCQMKQYCSQGMNSFVGLVCQRRVKDWVMRLPREILIAVNIEGVLLRARLDFKPSLIYRAVTFRARSHSKYYTKARNEIQHWLDYKDADSIAYIYSQWGGGSLSSSREYIYAHQMQFLYYSKPSNIFVRVKERGKSGVWQWEWNDLINNHQTLILLS